MVFKNIEEKYNILFKSNLTVPDIAKVLDVSESSVLEARLKLVGDGLLVTELGYDIGRQDTVSLNEVGLQDKNNSENENDLDSLAKNAVCEAYKLEGERDSFYKFFYRIANSYINSHFKYKEIKLGSAFKKLIKLNAQILNLEGQIEIGERKQGEICSADESDLRRKLKLELKTKIYKRNRLAKSFILDDMKEDYDCLVKLKKVFKSRDLKLRET
ncbi:hypothetical protein [Borrelia sp. RT5S]|uniref:hypothetical protein n=1 Tax=Borrelia sp. RT5S TaxID=2898581 RepID=UPI001E4FBF5F|nr:hypothetical protein [Borrelia sp. RT5S]UGQ16817.1 hypothetical protein LSO06_05700 [Borrelia sp. RT5S]